MAIKYYQNYWRYTDPAGRVYDQKAFQQYLDTYYPKRYDWDYSVQANAERMLTTTGGWKKVMNEPEVPKLEDVVGKFLLVNQHTEPRHYTWEEGSNSKGYWTVWNYKDLDTHWWRNACPDVMDEKTISWGHSCWLIGHDGTLTFVGADYDSSD